MDVQRGDDVLAVLPVGPQLLLKIDVERMTGGLQVLRGMRRFLRTHQPICSVEVTPQWLEQEGLSAQLLVKELNDLGYTGYYIRSRNGVVKSGIRLEPATRSVPEQRDVLFVPNAISADVLCRLDLPATAIK